MKKALLLLRSKSKGFLFVEFLLVYFRALFSMK